MTTEWRPGILEGYLINYSQHWAVGSSKSGLKYLTTLNSFMLFLLTSAII